MKMDNIGGLRLKRARVAQPRPVPPVLKWASWPPLLTSCASEGSHNKILTLKKSQVKLSLGRSLKRINTQNMVFLFCRVITKIRGSMKNPHKSMQNMIIITNNILICWNMHP
jgi:hypothetical protein